MAAGLLRAAMLRADETQQERRGVSEAATRQPAVCWLAVRLVLMAAHIILVVYRDELLSGKLASALVS
jgi:hypothetical protein